jgi:single-stranded DNA-binding protein
MKDAIECAFAGRIGQEPVLKESKAGKPWLAFSVAVGDGDDLQWIQVAAFGAKAEELVGSLAKSSRVYVEGRLKLNTWLGKDGSQQAGLKVAAWLVQPLGQIGAKRPKKIKGEAGKYALDIGLSGHSELERPAKMHPHSDEVRNV